MEYTERQEKFTVGDTVRVVTDGYMKWWVPGMDDFVDLEYEVKKVRRFGGIMGCKLSSDEGSYWFADANLELVEEDVQMTEKDWNEFLDGEYYTGDGDSPEIAMKFDGDKAPLAWIPRECTEGIAKVLAFGAEKYDKDNWRKGIPMSKCISASLRHINAYNDGEDLDPESGLPHIDHALCGLMFVQWYAIHRPECDDRYIK